MLGVHCLSFADSLCNPTYWGVDLPMHVPRSLRMQANSLSVPLCTAHHRGVKAISLTCCPSQTIAINSALLTWWDCMQFIYRPPICISLIDVLCRVVDSEVNQAYHCLRMIAEAVEGVQLPTGMQAGTTEATGMLLWALAMLACRRCMVGPLETNHLLTEGKALALHMVIAILRLPAMKLELAERPTLLPCLKGPLQCHTGVGVLVHPHIVVLCYPLSCQGSMVLLHLEAPFLMQSCLLLEGLHQQEDCLQAEWAPHQSSLAQCMLYRHMWTLDQV